MIIDGFKPAGQVQPNNFFQLPFNELYTGLANKQRYYDLAGAKADAAAQGMEGLMKSVDVWDTGAAYQRVSQFQSKIDSLKEKYPDYTDPMFNKELNKIIREGSSDDWWGKAIASKPIYEQWRKAYGESDAPMQNKLDAMSLIEQAATSPEGATSLFKGNVSPLNIPKYSDWGKTLQEIGKGVKADGNEKINIGGSWITKSEWEGITQEKALSALGISYKKDANGNYLDESGKPIKDPRTQAPVIDYDNMAMGLGAEDMRQLQLDAKGVLMNNPNLDYDTVVKTLYVQKAMQVANANTFSKTGEDVNANPYGLKAVELQNSIALKEYDKKEEERTVLDQLAYDNKMYNKLPTTLGNYSSDAQGFIDIINNPKSSEKEIERAKRLLDINGVEYPSNTSEASLKAYADKLTKTGNPDSKLMGEVLQTLISENPQGKTESSDAYYDRLNKGYQQFRDAFKDTEINKNVYTNKKTIEDKTYTVIGKVSGSGDSKVANVGEITNKGIVLLDEKGASPITDFNTFVTETLGLKNVEDFVERARVTGTADAVNDVAPTGYVAQYVDEKGKEYNFIISSTNYSEAKKNEPVFNLSQPMFNPMMKQSADVPASSLNLSGEGMKFLELSPNQTIITKREDNFDGVTYTPEMKVYVRTYNGNTYSEKPYTIQGSEINYNDFIDLYNTIIH